jgi:hypothetical protein
MGSAPELTVPLSGELEEGLDDPSGVFAQPFPLHASASRNIFNIRHIFKKSINFWIKFFDIFWKASIL